MTAIINEQDFDEKKLFEMIQNNDVHQCLKRAPTSKIEIITEQVHSRDIR